MARSTIEFNDAADRQLEYLSETLDIKSKAEVVRNALSLYAYLVELFEEEPARKLGIINEDDSNRIEKIILVPGLYSRAGARRVAATVAKSGPAMAGKRG